MLRMAQSGQSLERFVNERGLVPQRARWWTAKLDVTTTAHLWLSW